MAVMADQDRTDKVPTTQDLTRLLHEERSRLVLWLPVLMAIGIAIYFGLLREPSVGWGWVWMAPAAALTLFWSRSGLGSRVALLSALAVSGGFALAQASAHRADDARIRYPVGQTVEGRVLWVSRSASGAPRILLDRLVIYGIEPEQTPEQVRLTMLGEPVDAAPAPGRRVRVYATLMPTGDPVEPGAFDFNRRAYFERLGGIGLTRGTVLRLPGSTSVGLRDAAVIAVMRWRDAISRYLRQTIDGRAGAFAAAIIVGDRIDIVDDDAEALRASNLSHLLAISGLHMGILTGLVFSIARFGLALVPWTAFHLSTKKTAAIIALLAAVGYLMISGATVATQRAFIMVAVALVALLVNRPAITMRGLAAAAVIILTIRPISLMDAGFQMSFAATVALVAGYEFLRKIPRSKPDRNPGWAVWAVRIVLLYVGGLLLSSLLAGGATAPIAAFHFNRAAPYGLLSNLLALPIMGFWIAPLACLAAMAAPLGLAEPVLQLMGAGIEQILKIAHWVAELPGAVRPVRNAGWPVLACIALGGLWIAIWRVRIRMLGIAGIAAGFLLWSLAAPRPDVLISQDAKLIGILGPQGRALDHHKTQSFAAKTWLRRDGDLANQQEAAARAGISRDRSAMTASLDGGWQVSAHWRKNPDMTDLRAGCLPHRILIVRHGDRIAGPCVYIGREELRRGGAHAVHIDGDKAVVSSARDPLRQRLWTPR